MAKFLPHHAVVDPKYAERSLTSMLPRTPIPVEAIQSSEVTSPTAASNGVVVGSNPCAVPIATLSIRDLRLRGSSFIRSHASKHGLPNASRKLMKEVIELLKTHYAVVHQVTMLEDDFSEASRDSVSSPGGGGKITHRKKTSGSPKTYSSHGGVPPTMATTAVVTQMKCLSSPTMLPQRPMLVPFQVQMPTDQALISQVASIVERLPVDRRLQTIQHEPTMQQQPPQMTMSENGQQLNGHGSPCTARILARTRGELTSFGTSLLRPEAAAHKVHNSSRKPKHVVIDELWRHYVQYHSHDLMASAHDDSGCIGNVIDDEDDK